MKTFPDIDYLWILDTDDYARVALPTGLEETGQQAANAGDSSDVESVVEDDDAPGIEGMIGFADLLWKIHFRLENWFPACAKIRQMASLFIRNWKKKFMTASTIL